MRTAVIVLGDLGRSPRMQYHAVSLADGGGEVDLIGLEGAPPIPAIAAHPRIHVHRLADRSVSDPRPRRREPLRDGVDVPRRRGRPSACWRVLMRVPKPDMILVQNPPAVPTLGVAWLVAKLRGARLVIDWHNLSHTWRRFGWANGTARSARWREASGAGRAGPTRISPCRRRWPTGCSASTVCAPPSSTIARPQCFRVRRPAEAAALWAKVAASAGLGPAIASRWSCVRPAGRPTKTSICCSRRSSAPSGR